MRLVLDTNILVSALISSNTPPDWLYSYWEEERFDLVTSQAQLDELQRVLQYPLKRFIKPHEATALL